MRGSGKKIAGLIRVGAHGLARRRGTLVRILLLLQFLPLLATLMGIILFDVSGCVLESGAPSCPTGANGPAGRAGYALGFSALLLPFTLGVGAVLGPLLWVTRRLVTPNGPLSGGED